MAYIEDVNPDNMHGRYAIIRKFSESGHSPSRRYKTVKEAIAAAADMCEKQPNLDLQIVRVLAEVTSRPVVRVIRKGF